MKAGKWRDLSDDEIRQRARELSEEVFNVRFQLAVGMAKNASRLGQARRDLARAQTILRERGVPGVVTAVAGPARTEAPGTSEAKRRAPRGGTAARGRRGARPTKKG
ncbi:MAG: 50S ribosomal protein L29 [Candidatus Rokuibacteriota bacterium]